MEIKQAKRIVIKIGTNTLTNNGEFNHYLIEALAKEIADFQNQGKEFIIVSSGAVGIGKTIFKSENKCLLATIGQSKMMHCYEHCFEKVNLTISQLLLTKNHFLEEQDHIKKLLNNAIESKIITIINENDIVSKELNTFGDNDLLSAKICNLINADLQILLTNVNGIYKNKNKKVLKYSKNIEKLNSLIYKEKSTLGTGGMQSKILSAQIASTSKTKTIIANGNQTNLLNKIFQAKTGTILNLK
jgi:glutamate 5-kinase